MTITEFQGDLFTSNDNLCHCVSSDMYMGKGIATIFKKKYGTPITCYVTGKTKHQWNIGDVGVINHDGKKILYLVTKDRYYHKPTYLALQTCLNNIKNIDTISMPRIGCGLDGLQWNKVLPMITDTLTNTVVSIYSL